MTLFETVMEHQWPLMVAITALYVVNALLRYYRLRQFGGPWATGFTKIRHNINVFTGEAHHWYQKVSEEYGTSDPTSTNLCLTPALTHTLGY